jgi:hypothetical protein
MHYLFVTSLLAALYLPLSVIAAPSQTQCNSSALMAGAWFEDWDNSVTPSNLSWSSYNRVTFAFWLISSHHSIASFADLKLFSQ